MKTPYVPQYPHLCRYLHVGNVTLRSRMCSAPMGFPDLTEDGCLTEGAIAFYENRAKGGAAIVTISEGCVDYEHGKGHGRLINLTNPGVLAGLTNAARAIKRHGAVASIEINHAGMLSDFDVVESERGGDKNYHYGPVDCVVNNTQVKGMDHELIADVIKKWADGAALCKKAGFDMIMIHAGHGWLIHQFLSPLTNTRTDEYGGCLENRARLALEIIDAIRDRVGPQFPIEVRFSGYETGEGGITLADAVEFAKLIESKVNILHVSAGSESDFHVTHPSMFSEPGCNVRLAAEIKKHVSIPVATVGALGNPDQMEEIIASGKADIVCMARALLADPELPKKVEQNRTDEILPCIRCFVCHAERMLTQTRICAVNPEIGREYEAKFARPATSKKKVLVIGGGPGGMQFAVTAAGRGHDVTLCEKENELGGNLRCEFNVPFKSSFPLYVKTMQRRMELAGVKVMTGVEVTPDFVREFEPDALIVAVGAEPLILPLPGIDGPNVIPGTELEANMEKIGKKVVVLGGGMVGCESGIYLAQKGHEVTIVEMRDAAAPDANPRHRPALMKQLAQYTEVLTGLKGKAVTEEGLVCEQKDGSEVLIPADTVILASGLRPRTALTDSFRGTAPIVEVIGDCVKPDIIRGATFRAYHAALDL